MAATWILSLFHALVIRLRKPEEMKSLKEAFSASSREVPTIDQSAKDGYERSIKAVLIETFDTMILSNSKMVYP